MNPLKTKIGILGGGQLGRMLIEESLRLNVEFNVLEEDGNCPCKPLSSNFIKGKLTDEDKIRELAKISDVLTYEIEHVNTEALLKLEAEGKEIVPSPKILKIIQDKGLQKQFFVDNDIPTSPFVLVDDASQWVAALKKLGVEKVAAKTRTGGYDGKGVELIDCANLIDGKTKIPFNTPTVLEAFVECEKEIAVIVARDKTGNTLTYPSVEMEFDPQANLVTFLSSPANISTQTEEKATQIAFDLITAFNGIGVFAVEMFLDKQGNIYVNEVAPRPHNSGHHTIEACYTSQYEQLTRILLGLPLGSTQLIKPAVMLNLLGATDFSGSYKLNGLAQAMQIEGVYVHLYGKAESKPMRKMGHVTILGETTLDAHQKAKRVKDLLRFEKN